jgi:Polyketide cyclase / dehydrase and lipid transport
MASIHVETQIAVAPELAWDALQDWAAVHERLAPGFVTDARVDGDSRIVTFFTGTTLTERILAVDDERRRLVWSIIDGPYAHHNGAAQVIDHNGSTLFAWTTDLLPDETADRTRELMERGLDVIKATLESNGV